MLRIPESQAALDRAASRFNATYSGSLVAYVTHPGNRSSRREYSVGDIAGALTEEQLDQLARYFNKEMANALKPTGECWCGCGEQTGPRSYFVPGYDRRAEATLIRLEYGSMARLLQEHGYGPGGKNLMAAARN